MFGLKICHFFSYFGSLSCPSLTCQRAVVHTNITLHTTVLNGTRTGKLPVLISLSGSFKKCWTAITYKYATTVERICPAVIHILPTFNSSQLNYWVKEKQQISVYHNSRQGIFFNQTVMRFFLFLHNTYIVVLIRSALVRYF